MDVLESPQGVRNETSGSPKEWQLAGGQNTWIHGDLAKLPGETRKQVLWNQSDWRWHGEWNMNYEWKMNKDNHPRLHGEVPKIA